MSAQLATRSEESPSRVLAMMEKMAETQLTQEGVAALSQLVQLHERMEAKAAEKSWARDFAAMQSEMPKVVANKPVMNSAAKGGGLRYKYAPLEEILAAIQPSLTKFGFAISFNLRVEDIRMVAECSIIHRDGHIRKTEFPCRIVNGGLNGAQDDGSTRSYAKRYALCDAFNIPIDHDDDAGAIGGSILSAKAAEFERRCAASGMNVRAFLEMAGAQSFAEIPAKNEDVLENMLRRQESRKKEAK